VTRIAGNFALRFGYARWLRHLLSGEPPGYAGIGRATGLSGQAVSGWSGRAEAPTNYKLHRPLAEFLGVDRDWLIDGVGEAPDGDLWLRWVRARHEDHDAFADGAEIPTIERESFEEEDTPTRATGTSGRPNAKKRR
jgi:hypothetical protein